MIGPAELRNAFYYNENKCSQGNAVCLYAHLFPNDAALLGEREKIMRLRLRAALHPTAQKSILHISLNFHPSEKIENENLLLIVKEYMELIGYAEQPYLVYRHFDAGHPHVHVVASLIQSDGIRKKTQFIGRDISKPATRYLERKYGLVQAEKKDEVFSMILHPVDLDKVRYGELPTKSAISKVVRAVVKHYNFTSLPELNAVLNQFNVVADRGAVGSKMFEKKGLQYSLMTPEGKKKGVPIKASSIFGKPTLHHLEQLFVLNKSSRNDLKGRIRWIVRDILQEKPDIETFLSKMADEHIKVILRQNEDGFVYGMTFVDNVSLAVFNGRELGKSYSASGILGQLSMSDNHPSFCYNRTKSQAILRVINFKSGFKNVLKTLAMKGIGVIAEMGTDGQMQYKMGHIKSHPTHFWRCDNETEKYFRASGLHERNSEGILKGFQQLYPERAFVDDGQDYFPPPERVEAIIKAALDAFFAYSEEPYEHVSRELMQEAKRKKRKRKRL